MIDVLTENITSHIPKSLQSKRETRQMDYISMSNNYKFKNNEGLETTEEFYIAINIEFDTSVRQVTKKIYNQKFAHILETEDAAKLNVKGLVAQLNILVEREKNDKSLLVIFRAIENWMINFQFDSVNYFLNISYTSKWNEDQLIAILSSTLPWKDNIPNRLNFYNFVHDKLLIDYGNNEYEVNNILLGLR